MGFSRQEYWSGLPCPPPGNLPNPGINPGLFYLLHWQAGSLPLAPPGKPLKIQGPTQINQVLFPRMHSTGTEIPTDFIIMLRGNPSVGEGSKQASLGQPGESSQALLRHCSSESEVGSISAHAKALWRLTVGTVAGAERRAAR